MKKCLALVFIFSMMVFSSGCRKNDHYQVYALRYLDPSTNSARSVWNGADPKDSVRFSFMFWLLKGDDGRLILVDAGYIDSSATKDVKYTRPDLVLKRMNISPSDIKDLILTHPHWDHIGGVTLFPEAKIWMQKKDFDYYVAGDWMRDGHSRGYTRTSKPDGKNNISDILRVKSEGRLKFVDGDNL